MKTRNERAGRILEDICSADLTVGRNAIVRSVLVLEWDAKGYLDHATAEGFPQSDLYQQALTDTEVTELIHGLGNLAENHLLAEELTKGILWALGTSSRKEALCVIIHFLNKTQNLEVICANTDVLRDVHDRLNQLNCFQDHFQDITFLFDRLRSISFADMEAEEYRNKLLRRT